MVYIFGSHKVIFNTTSLQSQRLYRSYILYVQKSNTMESVEIHVDVEDRVEVRLKLIHVYVQMYSKDRGYRQTD